MTQISEPKIQRLKILDIEVDAEQQVISVNGELRRFTFGGFNIEVVLLRGSVAQIS